VRTDLCGSWGGRPSNVVVDGYLRHVLDECVHPTDGTAPSPPTCGGSMRVHFSRMPDFGGCGEDVTFTSPQPESFVRCLAKVFARERCSAGLWVGIDATVDTQTIDVCPSP
jgi:hypothetical protein